MRADIQLISPYHSSLALNRGGFPEGSACYHFDPIRYVVRGASHPVNSATVARPRRDQQEHAGYSPGYITIWKYTQLCDFVSQVTPQITGGKRRRNRPDMGGNSEQPEFAERGASRCLEIIKKMNAVIICPSLALFPEFLRRLND